MGTPVLAVQATITISLDIENAYELYDDVYTSATDVVVPAPPADDSDERGEWVQEHIYPLTGVGNTRGDSWHDVTITASSHPDLLAVGATFDFGY